MGNVYVEMLMWGQPPSVVPWSEAQLVFDRRARTQQIVRLGTSYNP
jgi:hypothetical protein